MENIHFSCTQCGQCCKAAPRMSFYDMIELSQEFIFQVGHQVRFSQHKQLLDTEVIKHYQKFCHTITLPEFDLSMFYHVDFMPIEFDSYKTCSKLKDNKCSIYHNRPVSCKLNPINYNHSENNQYQPISFFKKETQAGRYHCDFSSNAPLLMTSNNNQNYIYSHHTNHLYYNELSMHRDITDKYIEFLSIHGEDKKDHHFKTLYTHYSKNEMLITDVLFILQMAHYYHLLTSEKIKKFIENQIVLAEKESEVSKLFKNKNNLKTYRLYKKIIQDYKEILKTDNFSVYFENNI